MSVANILDNLVQEQIDPVWVAGGGGGVGTLSAVLAAGNSAGCQSMSDVFGIGGCPTVDLQITSVGPNADLILENNTASDGIILNAGTAIKLNCDQFASGANTSVQITAGQTDIQPNIGYPYGGNPDTPLKISNYNNPTGLVQAGLVVGPNSSIGGGEIQGVTIESLTTTGGGNAYGLKVDNLVADSDTYGSFINSIVSNSNNALGSGISGIQGDASANGLDINSISGTNGNADGIQVTGVTASTTEATGLRVGAITGASRAYGAVFNKVNGIANAGVGVEITNINGGNTSHGCRIDSIGDPVGTNAATGLEINTVVQDITAPSVVTGINVTDITGGNAVGIVSQKVTGEMRVRGVQVETVANTSPIGSASFATGIESSNVYCTNPGNFAFGARFLKSPLKVPQANGTLVQVANGSLGLSAQFVNDIAGPNNVEADSGNFVTIGTLAAVNIALNAPVSRWDRHWFVFSKQGAGPHSLVDSAGTLFNGVAGPFVFGGVANSMCLIFYTGQLAIGWAARVL